MDPQFAASAWTIMPFKTHRRANSSGTDLSPVPERSSRCLSLPTPCRRCLLSLQSCSPICSAWLGSRPKAGALSPPFDWSLWDKPSRLGALRGHDL